MHKKDAVVPHRQLCTNYPDGFTYHLTVALSLCHVESAFAYAKFFSVFLCDLYILPQQKHSYYLLIRQKVSRYFVEHRQFFKIPIGFSWCQLTNNRFCAMIK